MAKPCIECNGRGIKFIYDIKTKCDSCRGSGNESFGISEQLKCRTCEGSGVFRSGGIFDTACPDCKGKGVRNE